MVPSETIGLSLIKSRNCMRSSFVGVLGSVEPFFVRETLGVPFVPVFGAGVAGVAGSTGVSGKPSWVWDRPSRPGVAWFPSSDT